MNSTPTLDESVEFAEGSGLVVPALANSDPFENPVSHA